MRHEAKSRAGDPPAPRNAPYGSGNSCIVQAGVAEKDGFQ